MCVCVHRCVCVRACLCEGVCMRVCVLCYVFEAVHDKTQFAFVTSDKKEGKFKA